MAQRKWTKSAKWTKWHMHCSWLAKHPLLKWAKWTAWTKWLMQLYCPECAYLDLHHHHRAHHHHCHQHPNHHLPVGPQSDVQAPHRVGGASCWHPLFILIVPFRFVLAPSGQPNNSSTATQGRRAQLRPSFSRFTLTDSPTHTHTHAQSHSP